MKRIGLSLLLFSFALISLVVSPDESYANAHSSIQFRDGNATWQDGGYRPQKDAKDVMSGIERRWLNGTLLTNKNYSGGLHPRSVYNYKKGNQLAYDVYEGTAGHDFKKGWRVERHGGK